LPGSSNTRPPIATSTTRGIWTLVVRCALLLRAGASEIALSRLLSGILGMVSFQALAVFVRAQRRRAARHRRSVHRLVQSRHRFRVVYPVMLLDTHHTYGALGLS
jgi:hypothetical protein